MNIATRGKLPEYLTMVQEFLSTLPLPLPMTVYMLDYYLPMLSPNEGYNETGLTQQSAGPIRDPMQEIRLMYQYKGSEFGHWRVTGGWDAFAFGHPSLGQTDVYRLLESDAHHHKVSPIGTGRLIALVGVEDLTKAGDGKWQILFGLVFFFGRRHLPFGWSPTLRLTCGPAGNRTTTGSLSALSKDIALPTSPQGRLNPVWPCALHRAQNNQEQE